jgi:hypothetical protein
MMAAAQAAAEAALKEELEREQQQQGLMSQQQQQYDHHYYNDDHQVSNGDSAMDAAQAAATAAAKHAAELEMQQSQQDLNMMDQEDLRLIQAIEMQLHAGQMDMEVLEELLSGRAGVSPEVQHALLQMLAQQEEEQQLAAEALHARPEEHYLTIAQNGTCKCLLHVCAGVKRVAMTSLCECFKVEGAEEDFFGVSILHDPLVAAGCLLLLYFLIVVTGTPTPQALFWRRPKWLQGSLLTLY